MLLVIRVLLPAVVALGLLAMLPGPDFAVVTRFALRDGSGAGIRAAAGVVLGLILWGVLAVVGLAAILAASTVAYSVIRLVGATYLVLMGIRMLWRSRSGQDALPPRRAGHALRAGLFTNLLNPKIAVAYTSLLPSLVPHGASPSLWLPILVATHALLSLAWLSVYAIGFARSRRLLSGPRARRRLDRVTGVVLIAFGLRVAAAAR